MKKLLLCFLCTISAGVVNAQHQLTVKFSSLRSDTIVVQVIRDNMSSVEKRDTLVAKDGVVYYDVEGDKARLLNVVYKTDNGPWRVQAFAVPGEQGVLTVTGKKGKWSGTQLFSDIASFYNIADAMQEEMDRLVDNLYDQIDRGANADSLRAVTREKSQKISNEIEEMRERFIAEHPGNDANVVLMLQKLTEENLAKLGGKVRTGKFSNFISSAQARIDKDKAIEEARKAIAAGMPAPEFTLNDISGKPLALSSLCGKYVVLDFWGSWCVWCIKGFPEMKEYYEKYAGKFEILGIDCNDTEEKWKKAVADNSLPWKHVYNPRNSDVIKKYVVTGYPTKVIIDPQGRIYKTIIGESREFYQILDELFGK